MKVIKLLWAAVIFAGICPWGPWRRCQNTNIGGTLCSRQIKRVRQQEFVSPQYWFPKGTILIPYCHTLIPKQKHLRRFAKIKTFGKSTCCRGAVRLGRACAPATTIPALLYRYPNSLILSPYIDACQCAKEIMFHCRYHFMTNAINLK